MKLENYIFITGNYKKSEAIFEIIKRNNYKTDKTLFIDDKISHINDVRKLGIKSILTKDVY